MKYLTELRDKLQLINETAQENAVTQQALMKRYYDKQSTARQLAVGSLVLLLQPVSTQKVFAAWSGPHRVIERLSYTDVIDLHGRRAVRHVNLLRPYFSRNETIGVVLSAEVDDPLSADQLPTTVEYADDENRMFIVGDHLSDDKKQRLLEVLESFTDVFFADTWANKFDGTRNTSAG
jgi:hypothetical protein